MDNHILDNHLECEPKSKGYWHTLKESLPILITLTVSIYSIFIYLTTDIQADISRLLGIIGVFLSASLYFFIDRIKGLLLLLSLLFFGLFGLIKFTPTYSYLAFLGINFPFFATPMFLFTLYWSFSYLKIGLEQFSKIKFVKKILDWWYSLPE